MLFACEICGMEAMFAGIPLAGYLLVRVISFVRRFKRGQAAIH